MIKVSELIELLKKEDPERFVIMSIDAEGNNFHPLAEVGTGSYDQKHSEVGEDNRYDLQVVILWPV